MRLAPEIQTDGPSTVGWYFNGYHTVILEYRTIIEFGPGPISELLFAQWGRRLKGHLEAVGY